MCWLNIFGTARKQTDQRNLARNPLTMKADKNLFLYLFNFYTLAIVPLHTALALLKHAPINYTKINRPLRQKADHARG
jgi:hypothetical protein